MKCRKKMSKNTSKKINPLAQDKPVFCAAKWCGSKYLFYLQTGNISLFFPIYKHPKFCQGSNTCDLPIATQLVKINLNVLRHLMSSMVQFFLYFN